jgi:membrane-associated phospholipid phosphatase
MDWRAYHGLYGLSLHHHWLGSLFNGIEKASIPFIVAATLALWLLSRPGRDRTWKLAAASGFGAAALALLVNAVIHTIWDRPRPYEDHAINHPWASSTDPAFPSDHASASIAIAVAVFMFDRVVGALLLAAAALIAVGRVFVGAHYPADVLASLVVGAASAIVVVKLGHPVIAWLVRRVERATDPLLRPLWRAASRSAR